MLVFQPISKISSIDPSILRKGGAPVTLICHTSTNQLTQTRATNKLQIVINLCSKDTSILTKNLLP